MKASAFMPKRPSKISFFLILLGVFINISCKKEQRVPCPDPKSQDIYLQAFDRDFIPYRIGDTLKFKVYGVKKTDSTRHYLYRREEVYIARDTGVDEIRSYTSSSGAHSCESYIAYHSAFVKFSGLSNLQFDLQPGGATSRKYIHRFNNKYFYSSESSLKYKDNLELIRVIGDKQYENVSKIKGYQQSIYGKYTDSTYIFYSQEYGMVRAILHDTLVYERF